jgi:hypothetical protein
MADPLQARVRFGLPRLCLFKNSLLECSNLVGRQYEQKGLEEDDGLSETRIQVIVVHVHQLPHSAGILRGLVEKIGSAEAVVRPEVLNHVTQYVYLVEKLQTVGEQDVT